MVHRILQRQDKVRNPRCAGQMYYHYNVTHSSGIIYQRAAGRVRKRDLKPHSYKILNAHLREM